MLYFIGLGLGDENDITLNGLRAIKKSRRVFLEAYTSILASSKEELEAAYGCEITVADREMVEQQSDTILEDAKEGDVAFLVVGDPFAATTHTDLLLRAAKEKGIKTRTFHNASIMNAIASCGLQLYNFGQTVSIPFFDGWGEHKPYSIFNKIEANLKMGLHTLCLLDIKVKEQSMEDLLKGNRVFQPPRFMTVNQCIDQLLECVKHLEVSEELFSEETVCIGVARLGHESQIIRAAKVKDLRTMDFGAPLHSFVIPGKVHPIEEEMLSFYMPEAHSAETEKEC